MGISGSEQSVNEEQAALMSLKHGVREGFVPRRGGKTLWYPEAWRVTVRVD